MLNIAHRGASGEAPENTMAAFELALRQGADGLEFDVHLSSDGVPVVVHDARLERTTSGNGRVAAMPAGILKRLDAGSWFNRRYPARTRLRYAGLKVPTLGEVLSLVHKRQCLAFIEIKKARTPYPGIEEKVVEIIHRAGVEALSTVISFDLRALARARQLDSRISLGLDFSRPVLAIRHAGAVSANWLLPHWALAPRSAIERAHRAGYRVCVWGVERPLLMHRKILDGVDGIITRYPARLAGVLKSRKSIVDSR